MLDSIFSIGIELVITIHSAGLAPCDLLDQNFHCMFVTFRFLVLCFHFCYMCGCVYRAFILYSMNFTMIGYRSARFKQFTKRRAKKKSNHLYRISNHWWKGSFYFQQIISIYGLLTINIIVHPFLFLSI